MVFAALCLLAGFACIAFGYLALLRDKSLRQEVEEVIKELNEQAKAPPAPAQQAGAGIGGQIAQQSSFLGSGAEYIKALAELAGNLSKVSQGIAALLVATIFFAMGGALITIDHFDDDDAPPPAATATTATTP
jgi:predicted PurR-regulated permease PerM